MQCEEDTQTNKKDDDGSWRRFFTYQETVAK
jgi:hypothetical protein